MGDDWHLLWWVKRQVLIELVGLTRLRGRVSYGGCNCLVLGLYCQDYQAVTYSLGSLLILCTCTTPYSCGRFLLEYEHLGLPILHFWCK